MLANRGVNQRGVVAVPGEIKSDFGRWLLATLTDGEEVSSLRQKLVDRWSDDKSFAQFHVLWLVLILLAAKRFNGNSDPQISEFSSFVWSQLSAREKFAVSDVESIIRAALNAKDVSISAIPQDVFATICSGCAKALIFDNEVTHEDLVGLIGKAETVAISQGIALFS